MKPAERRLLPMQWVQELQTLFDFDKLRRFFGADKPAVLHGRLVLIGLSLLEPELRDELEQKGIFSGVVSEIREPIQQILSDRGRELFNQTTQESTAQTSPSDSASSKTSEPLDSVPNQPDEPLKSVDEDQLGRAAFARYLARRIEAVPDDGGAYAIHIYGPWGSGKSTLLNFMRKELEDTNKWVVCEFNAWRNQHISPPWWSLLDNVFQQTKRELSFWEEVQEYWWRLSTGRSHYILGLAAIVWIFALLIFPQASTSLKSLASIAENLSKVAAIILTVWGVITAFSRSLLFGSSKAAQTYMELTHDPMDTIKTRFSKLMARIQPKRTVVFIDDLDRCQSSYVIRLLEGVQTLFKDAGVVFVIAADRQWLNACYEENYEKFKVSVCEPGKPLGVLFLEKVFQFSTPVPGIPKALKETYWQTLISAIGSNKASSFADARQKARDLMAKAGTESAVLRFVSESKDKPFYEQQAIREEAVVRLAAPNVAEKTEHFLKAFAGLLDPNPRSMKRLVNSYSVNRAIATLSHVDIERCQLALWTIVSLRWPLLAEILQKNPEIIADLEKVMDGLSEDIAKLCTNEEVINVLKGLEVGCELDANVIRKCSILQM